MREKKLANIQIGEQIRKAREHASLTQEQLAERIEVSPQYISDLERGVVGISVQTLKRLCTSLCISSDQILFATQQENSITPLLERCQMLSPEYFSILSDIIEQFIKAITLAQCTEKQENKKDEL